MTGPAGDSHRLRIVKPLTGTLIEDVQVEQVVTASYELISGDGKSHAAVAATKNDDQFVNRQASQNDLPARLDGLVNAGVAP
ncbi:hypothetical protein AWV79_02175 [Cupriavidus sp. UYMMa02A]|nr:hypothetical protein AWV79_02175 [Cupriavidus sp. UYMMa02A]